MESAILLSKLVILHPLLSYTNSERRSVQKEDPFVGDDGVEPSTSFLSGKRSTAEPIALNNQRPSFASR